MRYSYQLALEIEQLAKELQSTKLKVKHKRPRSVILVPGSANVLLGYPSAKR